MARRSSLRPCAVATKIILKPRHGLLLPHRRNSAPTLTRTPKQAMKSKSHVAGPSLVGRVTPCAPRLPPAGANFPRRRLPNPLPIRTLSWFPPTTKSGIKTSPRYPPDCLWPDGLAGLGEPAECPLALAQLLALALALVPFPAAATRPRSPPLVPAPAWPETAPPPPGLEITRRRIRPDSPPAGPCRPPAQTPPAASSWCTLAAPAPSARRIFPGSLTARPPCPPIPAISPSIPTAPRPPSPHDAHPPKSPGLPCECPPATR